MKPTGRSGCYFVLAELDVAISKLITAIADLSHYRSRTCSSTRWTWVVSVRSSRAIARNRSRKRATEHRVAVEVRVRPEAGHRGSNTAAHGIP